MTAPSGPRTVLPLGGTWDIWPGTEAGPSSKRPAKISVPSLVDCARPSYDWQSSTHHWYRRRFRIPQEIPRGLATLRIDQAMFGTHVWLNDRDLGGDIACYTSQEYDATTAVRFRSVNEIVVRVGGKDTLPPESAVGRDQERTTFIPGIWGDVALILSGIARISGVQVIPRPEASSADVRVRVVNGGTRSLRVTVSSRIREHISGNGAGQTLEAAVTVAAGAVGLVEFAHAVSPLRAWSPADPFLYEHVADVVAEGTPSDLLVTRFGMREFCVKDGAFFLNGERIFLKGGNIAFHRFLSDADRALLPWDPAWIRKLLIDIPKAHNFNFFRAHIGQMYSAWYDIADEGGMLLQNEWMFWTTTGTEAQITKEFTRWLEDNWNHPSIVIWDALNESSDPVVQGSVVPKMKALDPTRPWESVDFTEEHPYIYSLGPVLNGERFGFARGIEEIAASPGPVMLNEFLWWWLDASNRPTSLMNDVVERWLGRSYTNEDLIARQSFLATELVELFRRIGADAIQPFVYLSNSTGPTGHWFLGDIARLEPKPVLRALANAFAPFGVSIELWDRNFTAADERDVRVYLFNDDPVRRKGTLLYGFQQGEKWLREPSRRSVDVGPSVSAIETMSLKFPESPGEYETVAELHTGNGRSAVSRKISHVRGRPVPRVPPGLALLVIEGNGEVSAFLGGQGIPMGEVRGRGIEEVECIVAAPGTLRDPAFQRHLNEIGSAVERGAVLVVIEPEFGITEKTVVPLLPGVTVEIAPRVDADRGGYDSYIFPEDAAHPLWRDIPPDHLRMFNGALGGEIVSRHTVTTNVTMNVLARCGLNLEHPVVMTATVGTGLIVISRVQTRGRLMPGAGKDSLYARRPDPVAMQYMLNCLVAFLPGEGVS